MLLQISFLAICYPVLILTYLGQAAWLTAFPDQVSSTFYASIPYGDGFYWVSAVIVCIICCYATALWYSVTWFVFYCMGSACPVLAFADTAMPTDLS